ncbi:hypothetical protein SAMN05216315_101124 [Nitrosospira sp. Nsp18]|uniref:hypothetical protein n=1 Tax=Nitrosospira sp. Nsp18 TaxID=1855334 RepID=UPI000880B93C|nr:hypothetical protein [Nitrosospira sp. Nsp18]SDA09834.1 hypothetical protein SAMN05216315_101124 [Nitrosospira sp. Nsp18]
MRGKKQLFYLNSAALVSCSIKGGTSDIPGRLTQRGLRISRRQFLSSAAALSLLAATTSKAGISRLLTQGAGTSVARILVSDDILWELDASWLAGRPTISTQQDGRLLTIRLRGAYYPGLRVSADFVGRVVINGLNSTISFDHRVFGVSVPVLLGLWLANEAKVTWPQVPSSLLTSFPSVTHITARKNSVAVLGHPSFEFDIFGEGQIEAIGSPFHFEHVKYLKHLAEMQLLANKDARPSRALVSFFTNLAQARDPLILPDLQLRIGATITNSVDIEVAENLGRKVSYAVVVRGSAPSFVESIQAESSTRIVAYTPTLIKAVHADSTPEFAFSGRAGKGVVAFADGKLTLRPFTEGTSITAHTTDDGCDLLCAMQLDSLALPTSRDLSVRIQFIPNKKESAINALKWLCDEISAQKIKIEFRRPADMLFLRMELLDAKIIKEWGRTRFRFNDSTFLRIILPPQAVEERSYYEPPSSKGMQEPTKARKAPPEWVKKQVLHDAANATTLQEHIEKAYARKVELRLPTEFTADNLPAETHAAGESWLSYTIKKGLSPSKLKSLHISLETFFDSSLWVIEIVPDARSQKESKSEGNKSDAPQRATNLEIPRRLHLSPNEKANFIPNHFQLSAHNNFHQLFVLRGLVGIGAELKNGIPLRAIATPWFDYYAKKELPPHFPDNQFDRNNPNKPYDEWRSGLDIRDRIELVWLTSQWGQKALPGTENVLIPENVSSTLTTFSINKNEAAYIGIYQPQPLNASYLALSAIGGYASWEGKWDPPALIPFAFSLQKWTHKSSEGRDHLDEPVYKDFLAPYQLRISIVRRSAREERMLSGTSVYSPILQKFFLLFSAIEVTYDPILAPDRGFTWPFSKIKILDVKPGTGIEIDAPLTGPKGIRSQSVFVPRINCKPLMFRFEIDGDQQRVGKGAALVLDNTVAHSEADLIECEDVFNNFVNWTTGELNLDDNNVRREVEEKFKYKFDMGGSQVAYAASREIGDTSFPTKLMDVRLALRKDLVNTAVLESSRKPPLFPFMDKALIEVPAIEQLTQSGRDCLTMVRVAESYRQYGFPLGHMPKEEAVRRGQGEIFLELVNPVTLDFSSKADRGGGIGSPNLLVGAISRTVGLVGLPGTMAGAIDGATNQRLITSTRAKEQSSTSLSVDPAVFDAAGAMLFGSIPISRLLAAAGLEGAPAFVEKVSDGLKTIGADALTSAREFAGDVQQIARGLKERLNPKHLKPEALSEAIQKILDRIETIESICIRISSETNPVQAVKYIGDIGAALRAIQHDVDDMLANPALFLPPEFGQALLEVAKAIGSLRNEFGKILALAHAALDEAIKATREELKRKLLFYFEEQVKRRLGEFLALLHEVDQNIKIDANDIFTRLLALISKYDALASELSLITDDIEKLDSDCITKFGTLGGDLQDLIGSVYQALVTKFEWIDQRFRDTLQKSTVSAYRSFFLQIEPQIIVLADQILELKKGVNEKNLARSGNALTQASRAIKTIQEFADQLPLSGSPGSVAENLARIRNFVNSLKMGESLEHEVQKIKVVLVSNNYKRVIDCLANATQLKLRLEQITRNVLEPSQPADMQAPFLRLEAIGTICSLSGGISVVYPLAKRGVGEKLPSVRHLSDEAAIFANTIIKNAGILLETFTDLFGKAIDAIKTNNSVNKLFQGLVSDLEEMQKAMTQIVNFIKKDSPLDSVNRPTLINDHLSKIVGIWQRTIQNVQSLAVSLPNEALQLLRDELKKAIEKVVPSRRSVSNTFCRELTEGYLFFCPGLIDNQPADLKLDALIELDLLTGASTTRMMGTIKNFRINVLGFLFLPIKALEFKVENGTARLGSPDIGTITLSDALSWVKTLGDLFQAQSGPYAEPTISGVRAGYRVTQKYYPTANMVLENFVLDAYINLPFDGGATTFGFAISSREHPCELTVMPYGGRAHFVIETAGDRLVRMDASFAYGLCGVFKLVAVKGTGKVMVGVIISQSANVLALTGFFIVLGSATVLGIVSISVSLTLSLEYQSSSVVGHGEFSVKVGCWPVEWTLNYSVDYAQKGAQMSTNQILINEPSQEPVEPLKSLFLDPKMWDKFDHYFTD